MLPLVALDLARNIRFRHICRVSNGEGLEPPGPSRLGPKVIFQLERD